jgi:hypothetical protein
MKLDNVKCCPACGTPGILKKNNMTYVHNELTRNCYVYCPRCDFRGPRVLYSEFATKAEANKRAVDLWNRRV